MDLSFSVTNVIREKKLFVKGMKGMFTDSHAHLTSDAVFADLSEILKRAREKQVDKIVNICTDKDSLERGIALGKEKSWIHNVGATTPHDVEKEGTLYFPLFEAAAKEGNLVAIGETGLDYHYEHSPKDIQKTFLARYFNLAQECLLPVVIHCREAFEDLYAIAAEAFPKGQAVLHCFTGTMKEAEIALEKNWMISFSGILTFKRSDALRAVAKQVPLDSILIETDTPYLAPQSMRGNMNEPSFIHETAQTLANIKGIPLEKVAEITSKNAERFFHLDL